MLQPPIGPSPAIGNAQRPRVVSAAPQSPFSLSDSYSTLRTMTQWCEKGWSLPHSAAPHYQWVAVPVFKALGGRYYPAAATVGSFAAMHILFHHFPTCVIKTLVIGQNTTCSSYGSTLAAWLWFAALPVVLKKSIDAPFEIAMRTAIGRYVTADSAAREEIVKEIRTLTSSDEFFAFLNNREHLDSSALTNLLAPLKITLALLADRELLYPNLRNLIDKLRQNRDASQNLSEFLDEGTHCLKIKHLLTSMHKAKMGNFDNGLNQFLRLVHDINEALPLDIKIFATGDNNWRNDLQLNLQSELRNFRIADLVAVILMLVLLFSVEIIVK